MITAVLYLLVSIKLHQITKGIRKQQQKEQQEESASPTSGPGQGKSFGFGSSSRYGTMNSQAPYTPFSDVTWKLMAHTAVVFIAAFPLFCHAITIELFDVDPYIPSLVMAIFDNSTGWLNLLVYLTFYRSKAQMQH
ncbi:hypothetical protein HK102_012191, partial [Quaeritorhiza haematococci]